MPAPPHRVSEQGNEGQGWLASLSALVTAAAALITAVTTLIAVLR